MLKYYEPHLKQSAFEHLNTMGVIVSLKDPVDGDLLQAVTEELRVRFPYFYVKAAYSGSDLIPVTNALPMTVRNTWEPINLNSEESNYHLAAWKYKDQRLAFEIPHSMTDGAGVLPYIKSAMFLYLSKATGKTFDPAGFRLPGEVIPESETGDPFLDLDVDSVEGPFYTKKPIPDFFRLVKGEDIDKRVFYLKFPEEQVMKYCRDKDATPNVLFSVILAKAARRYDPDSEKTITVCVAIDHKAILGNHDNYRLFVGNSVLDFPKTLHLDDITRACTIARGQLMLQIQPENSLWAIKQRKRMLPDPSPDIPQASICVSNAKGRGFGPLDPYIEEMFIVTTLSKLTDILCEVTCINNSFCLAFLQPFSSARYFECFLKELSLAGIQYKVLFSEPLRMCGIEQMKCQGAK